MLRRMRSPIYRFLAGMVVIISTTAVLYGLRAWLNSSTVALLYVLAGGASTAGWGLIPGLGAALSAFLLFNFLFIPPYFTLRVFHPQDVIELIILLVVAIVVNQLLGRAQTATASARAHERETQRLYELSAALIGQAEFAGIARTIARGAQEAFAAQAVRVTVAIGEIPEAIVYRDPRGTFPRSVTITFGVAVVIMLLVRGQTTHAIPFYSIGVFLPITAMGLAIRRMRSRSTASGSSCRSLPWGWRFGVTYSRVTPAAVVGGRPGRQGVAIPQAAGIPLRALGRHRPLLGDVWRAPARALRPARGRRRLRPRPPPRPPPGPLLSLPLS